MATTSARWLPPPPPARPRSARHPPGTVSDSPGQTGRAPDPSPAREHATPRRDARRNGDLVGCEAGEVWRRAPRAAGTDGPEVLTHHDHECPGPAVWAERSAKPEAIRQSRRKSPAARRQTCPRADSTDRQTHPQYAPPIPPVAHRFVLEGGIAGRISPRRTRASRSRVHEGAESTPSCPAARSGMDSAGRTCLPHPPARGRRPRTGRRSTARSRRARAGVSRPAMESSRSSRCAPAVWA